MKNTEFPREKKNNNKRKKNRKYWIQIFSSKSNFLRVTFVNIWNEIYLFRLLSSSNSCRRKSIRTAYLVYRWCHKRFWIKLCVFSLRPLYLVCDFFFFIAKPETVVYKKIFLKKKNKNLFLVLIHLLSLDYLLWILIIQLYCFGLR